MELDNALTGMAGTGGSAVAGERGGSCDELACLLLGRRARSAPVNDELARLVFPTTNGRDGVDALGDVAVIVVVMIAVGVEGGCVDDGVPGGFAATDSSSMRGDAEGFDRTGEVAAGGTTAIVAFTDPELVD